ncbi:hypothetical protein ACVWXO_001882 [Bradyrhizobium sp. LM2.7]
MVAALYSSITLMALVLVTAWPRPTERVAAQMTAGQLTYSASIGKIAESADPSTARKQKVSNGPRLRIDAWRRDGFLTTATCSAAP